MLVSRSNRMAILSHKWFYLSQKLRTQKTTKTLRLIPLGYPQVKKSG